MRHHTSKCTDDSVIVFLLSNKDPAEVSEWCSAASWRDARRYYDSLGCGV